VNPLGLHARPISEFVRTVARFEASVRVGGPGGEADGSSVLDMMRLQGAQGCELEIIATGPQAQEVLQALGELVSAGFGEI
jgi:phosphotransferase system HPr (HPr) family protein